MLVFVVGCTSELTVVPRDGEIPKVPDGVEVPEDPDGPIEELLCSTGADCVPVPGCHPMECVSLEEYDLLKTDSEEPMFCTEIYMYDAAYNKEDCVCREGLCVNQNLGRSPEL